MKRLPIVQDLINAYEDHSRSDFDRHLERLEQMLRYTGPVRQVHCARHEQAAPCQRCVEELLRES